MYNAILSLIFLSKELDLIVSEISFPELAVLQRLHLTSTEIFCHLYLSDLYIKIDMEKNKFLTSQKNYCILFIVNFVLISKEIA